MRRAIAAVLAGLMLFLGGCALKGPWNTGDSAEQSDGAVVYRVASDGRAGDLIRGETLPGAEEWELEELAEAFAAPARDEGLACALPEGVTVAGCALENGVVTLELSESFLDGSEMDRTVAALCAALTLCQLDGVEAVTVTAGGRTVFSGLTPEDALLAAADTDPYVRRLRLYFPDADGRYLVSEYHSLTLAEDASPERYVVEELLRGPNSAELRSAMPAGTELLSCRTENGVCTVDLSAAFYDGRPETALGERLCLYSLVDSLTALSGVDGVRVLVEGQEVRTYVYRSLADTLVRYDAPIGPVAEPKGELDADLYLTLPDLEHIAALPFRVGDTDHDLRAEAVLSALLSAAEPGYPEVFPGSGSVTGLDLRGSLCTVDLSESFFVSIPAQAHAAAMQSVAATLCALPEISAVRFTVGGGEAVFDGADYSGPWRNFDEIEVK